MKEFPGVTCLSLDLLYELVHNAESELILTQEVLDRAEQSQVSLERYSAAGAAIYGLNTGYGGNATSLLDARSLTGLQDRLTAYLDCGVGPVLGASMGRAALVARIWSLSQGLSAVTPGVLKTLVCLFNAGISPVIPRYGSLGASGDLVSMAPLAALAAGKATDCWVGTALGSGPEVLKRAAIVPCSYSGRDALGIMNGLSAATAIAALQAHDVCRLIDFSLYAVAATGGALGGFPDAFVKQVNSGPARHFQGQQQIAAVLSRLLSGQILRPRGPGRLLQDEYSLRCTPQALGPVVELVDLYKRWICSELNSVSDNPICHGDDRPRSGGNFFGGYIAQAADGLCGALARLGDLLDRQIFLMVDGLHGLAPNLVDNSTGIPYRHGVKGVHQTATALTMELQRLAAPAAPFSRSAEVHNQDIVSNAMNAVMKLVEAVSVAAGLVACHALIACEAASQAATIPATSELVAWHKRVRACVAPLLDDRPLRPDLQRLSLEATRHDLPSLLF